jgi:hypothetical protein
MSIGEFLRCARWIDENGSMHSLSSLFFAKWPNMYGPPLGFKRKLEREVVCANVFGL